MTPETNKTILILLCFTVSIESVGILSPQLLLSQAIQILLQKSEGVLQAMDSHHGGEEEMLTGSEDEDADSD